MSLDTFTQTLFLEMIDWKIRLKKMYDVLYNPGFGEVVQHLQRPRWFQCSCGVEPVCHLFHDSDGLQH